MFITMLYNPETSYITVKKSVSWRRANPFQLTIRTSAFNNNPGIDMNMQLYDMVSIVANKWAYLNYMKLNPRSFDFN